MNTRRTFITLLGSAALASPWHARAQQAGRLPTVGVLGTASSAGWDPWLRAFAQRLGEFGWIEGRTIAIERRWAEGRDERYAEIAAEFVRLKVDIILTSGIAVPALKQATSVIPIVFALSGDPVANGLVASLARPGGNVTGLSTQGFETAGKRLEILREVVTTVRRLAVMANAGNQRAMLEMAEVESVARKLGLDAETRSLRQAEDIGPAFESITGRADALYVCNDPLVTNNNARINSLALAARLPTIYTDRENVSGGGLMSYGPSYVDLFRRAADFVDKILRGAKPADLPVEQPTKFDLVINLTTAKALGLKIPESFLLRADEVIE